jgi:hypothetical protein
MNRRTYGWTCPHCGNRDKRFIEANTPDPRADDPDLTLLCVARVLPGEDAFGGDPPQDVGADGTVPCAMQWQPNEWRNEG